MESIKTWLKSAASWEVKEILAGAKKLPQHYEVVESESSSDFESNLFDVILENASVDPRRLGSINIEDGVVRLAVGLYCAGEMTWVLFADQLHVDRAETEARKRSR